MATWQHQDAPAMALGTISLYLKIKSQKQATAAMNHTTFIVFVATMTP